MRKLYVLLLVVLLCGTQYVQAQTNLSGRVYYNANIMADEMNKMVKDAKSDITKKRNEMIAKKEKDLGRKLNQKELAMIDEGVQKGQKMMDAVRKGMKTAITITFKNENELVMKADMKIDDEVMKAAGIGWAKRKLYKAALAVMPAQKGKYVVKGNTIYIDEGGNERDTLYISKDGKQLYGKMDNKKYTLNRVK
ncbi:MAG: hypothetical protein IJL29_02640 [Prevotella sp.]|nr:hypothetical protein [Prevotella sp.]MBQ6031902.1 hypothetical protein [Prevotella sp.]MBQ7716743.1 hypothetical protein [Prevotella sp.]